MTDKEIFEKLDYETIQQWVKTGKEEHLTLEFKTVGKADFTVKEDKKNLAKSLSGFANSNGGVIVWGVKTKAGKNGPCAWTVKEIDSLALFHSKLLEFTGQFVRPLVEGVNHRTIPNPTDADKGFAATLVPESDSGPHMAKGGVDRYYKRSGSSFYPMEHFDIADMFGRRRKPELALSHRVQSGGGSSGGGQTPCFTGTIMLYLRNSGRAPARDLFLRLRILSTHRLNEHGIDGWGRHILSPLPRSDPGRHCFGGTPGAVLHPGLDLDIACINFTVTETTCPPPVPPAFELEYEVVAQEYPLKVGRLVISGEDLLLELARAHKKEKDWNLEER